MLQDRSKSYLETDERLMKTIKFLWIVFLGLSICISGFAQGGSALERVDSLAELGEYKKAISMAEDYLETGPRNFSKSLAYFRLSKAHLDLGDFALAKDYNKESQSIKERLGYEYFADNVMQSGLIASAEGDPALALEYYQEASYLPHESILFSAALERNIGDAKLKLEDYTGAEEKFNNTIELLRWEVGEVHVEMVKTYLSLGQLNAMQRDWLSAFQNLEIARNQLDILGLGALWMKGALVSSYLKVFALQDGEQGKVNSFYNAVKLNLKSKEAIILGQVNEQFLMRLAITKEEVAFDFRDYSRSAGNGIDMETFNLASLGQEDFAKQSFRWYKLLIAPMSSVLDQTDRITVLLYDELQGLPMEALIRQEAVIARSYSSYDFMMERYTINYEQALQLFLLRNLRANTPRSIALSEDFPKQYKRKVKKKYKQFVKKGNSHENAILKTKRWMLTQKGMNNPEVWLGVN